MPRFSLYCLIILFITTPVTAGHCIEIGNPQEIFLRDIPDKYKAEYIHDRKDPTSFAEFSEYFKKDYAIFKQNLSTLDEDLKDDVHKGFEDPDFVPPERPDWR